MVGMTGYKAKHVKDMYEIFYDQLKKEIDFTKLTVEEARELGFKKWSEEEEDVRDLWLFPLYLTPIIPDDFEVIDIYGEPIKYEKCKMDNDIRFGCVAYGIIIKE